MYRSILISLLLIAIPATGLNVLRSPKDAANQPRKQPRKAVKSTGITPQIEPQISAVVLVRTNHPFHLTIDALQCTDSIAIYKLYVGTNGLGYYDRWLTSSVPSITVSNLWPNTAYKFEMHGISILGEESSGDTDCIGGKNHIAFWPMPLTNWVAFGWSVTTNGPWTTNTVIENPTNAFWRGLLVGNAIALQSSTDLQTWTTTTNWPVSNPPTFFYLLWAKRDNRGGYAKPD